MLFDSSIRKELGRNFGATLVVLVTVVMTMMLIRTLGQASKGVVSPSDVLLIMGLTVLGHLSTILTLSLFVALVATLSRMYRDSEMVIWLNSGQGFIQQLRPMLRFGWPVVAVVAALALLVWPWSNQQVLQLRSQFEQRSDLDRIAPGEFQESSDGQRVIFIEKNKPSDAVHAAQATNPSNQDAVVNNIFILERTEDAQTITYAQSARLEYEKSYQFAVLNHGQRVQEQYDSPEKQGELKITDFEQYQILVRTKDPVEAVLGVRAYSSPQLWQQQARSGQEAAELGWRISQPLLGLNLIILALALTKANPRTGQSLSVMLALLAFVVYYNLVSVGQSWVASGKTSLWVFVWGLHGSVMLLSILGVGARHYQWRWR
ncbi:MAG: LPS export ABC transporter permease LptF [Comamonas sp.]|nr:LPS export ABC transporter permease LptF [Comamonas sp.]